MQTYSMITIVAAILVIITAPALNMADVKAQPIQNCPPGTHVELIGQDFTCIRDIDQKRAQVIPNQEPPCVGCEAVSPGISGLKENDQSPANQYQGPAQVKPGEGPTDEQHCIGCENAPSGIEDTNIPELKK
jgi:hypothetical protein